MDHFDIIAKLYEQKMLHHRSYYVPWGLFKDLKKTFSEKTCVSLLLSKVCFSQFLSHFASHTFQTSVLLNMFLSLTFWCTSQKLHCNWMFCIKRCFIIYSLWCSENFTLLPYLILTWDMIDHRPNILTNISHFIVVVLN